MNAADSTANTSEVSGLKTDEGANVTYKVDGADRQEKLSFGENNSFGFAVEGSSIDEIGDNFRVELTDVAMNTNYNAQVGAQGLPEETWWLIQNDRAPEIKVDFDNYDARNGSFYNSDRTVTVTVTADHFDLLQTYSNPVVVNYSEDDSRLYVTADKFTQTGSNVWTWSTTFSSDADCTLDTSFTDLAGQYANGGSYSWTIDKTAPSANIVWDNENATNGNYYAAQRTATLTITEHNFDAGVWNVTPTGDGGNASEYGAPSVDGWTSYGDSHICHITFPGQGKYSMTVPGEDSAKNSLATYDVTEFVVDTVQPEISISVNGEADASSHAYSDGAGVSISVSDTNVDSSSQISVQSISWNGSGTPYTENRTSTNTSLSVDMPNPAAVPESDGVYRVTVNAQDLAGNTQTKTVDWSVNRFGSTYIVSESTQGIVSKKYVKSSDMSDVMITEINPSGVNEDTATAKVAKGTNTQTVQKGQGFTFANAQESNGWPAFSYTIDKDQYSSDAMYQTIVSSTDAAGRTSDNTMAEKNSTRQNSADVAFAVDNTAPIVSFSGFDEDVVAGTTHKVNAYVEDNMKLDHAVIEINGNEVMDLSTSDLNDKSHEITLGESKDTQTVTVKAYDAAGNLASIDSTPIFINSDPFARLMHNTVLFVGLIIAAVVIIGGLLWYFFYYRRKKREEEEDQQQSPRQQQRA